MSATPDPASLQKLFDVPDTVTHVLETLTGETLVADVAYQHAASPPLDGSLGLVAGETLTERRAVLRGLPSGRPYVRARSLFAPERLPEPVRIRLAQSTDPIGRILADQGARLRRAQLVDFDGRRGRPSVATEDTEVRVVWSRSYRLLVDDRPMFVVHEDFLDSIVDVLGEERSGRR